MELLYHIPTMVSIYKNKEWLKFSWKQINRFIVSQKNGPPKSVKQQHTVSSDIILGTVYNGFKDSMFEIMDDYSLAKFGKLLSKFKADFDKEKFNNLHQKPRIMFTHDE